MDTIGHWGPIFKLSFELIVFSKVPYLWTSVLAFRGNGGEKDVAKYGDRIPAIFYNKNGYLQFSMAVSGNKNYKIKKEIDLGKWYLIEIEQILNKGKVGYMIIYQIVLTVIMERFTTQSEWMERRYTL